MKVTWHVEREIIDDNGTPVWFPGEVWPEAFGGTAAADRATELAALYGSPCRVRLVAETVTFTAKP